MYLRVAMIHTCMYVMNTNTICNYHFHTSDQNFRLCYIPISCSMQSLYATTSKVEYLKYLNIKVEKYLKYLKYFPLGFGMGMQIIIAMSH